MDLTLDTVTRRARNYKTLVMAIVVASATAVLWAALSGTLTPLCGCLLLVPLCGAFSYYDSIVVNNWKFQLLSSWSERQLDFSALNNALNSIPMLPLQTVNSMMALLPFSGDLHAERKISTSTRRAIATASAAVGACWSDAIALNVASYAIIAVALIIAMDSGTWQPLLMSAPALAQRPLRTLMKRLRFHAAWQELAVDQQNPDFDSETYRVVTAGFQGNVIPNSMRARFS